MKKVKLNDGYIYINDEEVDIKKTGVVIDNEKELEKTKEIVLDNQNNLEDTLTDIFGDSDGK